MSDSIPGLTHWHDEVARQYATVSLERDLPVSEQLAGIWGAAVERSGDSLLSVHIGQIFRPNFSLFTSLLMWCPTVGESLRQLTRFWSPHAEAGRFSEAGLEPRSNGVELNYRLVDGGLCADDAQFRLTRVLTFMRHISDPSLTPHLVRFRHAAPAARAEVEQAVGGTVLWDQPVDSLSFDRAALDLPVLATTTQRGQIVRLSEQVLAGIAEPGNLPGLLRETIRGHLRQGEFGMKAIAEELRLSPRTLQRHLQHGGTSFQELLDEVRKEECLQSMQAGAGPYSEIAKKLGYSNVANFHRAFRRWFRETPNQMRRRLAATATATPTPLPVLRDGTNAH